MSTTESSFSLLGSESDTDETLAMSKQKIVVVGAGPVGALAAIYAAQRGHDVEIYELRNGKDIFCSVLTNDLLFCCILQGSPFHCVCPEIKWCVHCPATPMPRKASV